MTAIRTDSWLVTALAAQDCIGTGSVPTQSFFNQLDLRRDSILGGLLAVPWRPIADRRADWWSELDDCDIQEKENSILTKIESNLDVPQRL